MLSFNVNLRYYLEVLFIYLTWLTEVLVLVAAGLVVFVKVGLQGEGLVALPALVVLEGGVGLHVGPQVGPVSETLPAVGTAKWLVSSVRPQYSDVFLTFKKVIRIREGLIKFASAKVPTNPKNYSFPRLVRTIGNFKKCFSELFLVTLEYILN